MLMILWRWSILDSCCFLQLRSHGHSSNVCILFLYWGLELCTVSGSIISQPLVTQFKSNTFRLQIIRDFDHWLWNAVKKGKLYLFAFSLKNEISVKLLNNPWIWLENEISAIVIFSRKNENTELLFISEIFFYLTTAGRIFDQYKHLHMFYYSHNDIWCLHFI